MSTRARISVSTERLDWTKTSDGYALVRGGLPLGPTLVRRGRSWALVHEGQRVELGRRASFDTAESALLRLGWSA